MLVYLRVSDIFNPFPPAEEEAWCWHCQPESEQGLALQVLRNEPHCADMETII